MQLRLEPVTQENRLAVLSLRAGTGQEGFVETVSACLDEAAQRADWRPVAIYDGTAVVGFAMYGYFWEYPPAGRVWLDRLLIDQRYQGQGYGKAAFTALLHRLYAEYPHRRKIYLSVIEANVPAICLYSQFGFQFTGELDTHGEKVMVQKRQLHK